MLEQVSELLEPKVVRATCASILLSSRATAHANASHSTAMATPEQIIQQLKGCTEFFNSQGSLLGAAALAESQHAMARSMSAQIANLASLDVALAAAMTTAIATSGFGTEQKNTLAKAVAQRTTSAAHGASQSRKGTQTLWAVQSYFTEKDWTIFLNPATTIHNKVLTMVDRLCLIGVRNPAESCIKACSALLSACHFKSNPDANMLHTVVTAIKSGMQSRKSAPPNIQYVQFYPDDPAHLPDDVYRHGYPDDSDPPVTKSIDGFNSLHSRIPMRSTNKTLSAAAAAATDSSHSTMVQMLSAFLQQHAGEAQLPGLVINPRMHTAAASSAMSPKAAIALMPHPASPTQGGQPLAIQDMPSPDAARESQSPVSQTKSTGVLNKDQNAAADGAAAPSDAIGTPQLATNDLISDMEKIAAAGINDSLDKTGFKGKAKAKGKSKASGETKSDAIETAEGKAKAKAGGKAKAKAGGKAKAKACGKAKAKACGKAKAKAGGKAKAKAGGKAKAKAHGEAHGGLKLGCGKCRGSPKGCLQCRDPSYGGHRWTK